MRFKSAILAGLVIVPMLAVAAPAAAAAPSNDEPTGATVVTGGSHIVEDFTEATANAADPAVCGMGPLYNTVWFSFTPTEAADLAVTIVWDGVYGEGAVAIYPDEPTGWACGNTTVAQPGHTYWIMAGLWSPPSGPVTMTVDVTATVRPPLPSFTIDPVKVTTDRAGVAHVEMRVSCNQSMEVAVWVSSLEQNVGRWFTIRGSGQLSQACTSGPAVIMTVDVPPASGQFGGGRATLVYGGSAWNNYDWIGIPDTTVIAKIRG